MELEKRGVPTVVVCGKGFEKAARSFARAYKFPALRLLLVDDLIAHQGGAELRTSAYASVETILGALRNGEAQEVTAHDVDVPPEPTFVVAGDYLAANQELLERGLTDGLPVIPPTHDLVQRFVTAAGRTAPEVVARLMPRLADITVECLAANAVMAGCDPEVMPILIAATQAMQDETFSINHLVTTAHPLSPLLIVNGPIARQVGMSDGRDLSARGWRANATIARAVRLLLYNCAADLDSRGAHTQGHLGKFVDAVTENVEHSPWEPLHVERGFREADNVVTVFPGEPLHLVDDHSAVTAQGILGTFGSALASSGNRPMFGKAEQLLIFCPEHANKVAQGGFDKSLLRDFLYEVYRIPVHTFPPESRERWSQRWKLFYGTNASELATMPVVEDKNDLVVLCSGGAGPHSLFVPGFLNGRSVSVKIP